MVSLHERRSALMIVAIGLAASALVACTAPAAPAPAPTAAPAAKVSAEATKPAAVAAVPANAPKMELRAGTTNPKGDRMADAMDKFIELVDKKTNGTIAIKNLYTSAGVEYDLAQLVIQGSMDLGQISNGNSARFSNAYMPWDLPFLFRDYDAMLKVLDSPIGLEQVKQFEKDSDLKVMFTVSEGSGRDVETRNKQLKVPADIKGLKIRTLATPIDLATFKAWGANPTPLDWGQTYAAVQQGVLDGLQIPISSTLSSKMYEVVKYELQIEYQMAFNHVFMSPKKFNAMTQEQQKAVLEAAEEARVFSRDWSRQAAQKAQADLEKAGMTFYKPNADEWKQWASIRDQVWSEVAVSLKDKLDMNVVKKLEQATSQ